MIQTMMFLVLKMVFLVHLHSWYLGALSGCFLMAWNAKEESRMKIPLLVAGLFSLIPLFAFVAVPYLAYSAKTNVERSGTASALWIGATIISLCLTIWWLRYGVQTVERVKSKLTRSSALERNKKTDIREIDTFLPSDKKRFDPLKFINYKKGFFVGLSEDDRPIYIRRSDWETSHILLTGRTRSGKGVAAQILGTQSIQAGELFVVLDPKCDNWMPHIYKDVCDKAGKQYVFLDLRQSAHPQINMFQNCDAETLENMLIAAFSLAEKGDNADFYRLGDRRAARQAAQYIAANPNATPIDVLNEFGSAWNDKEAGAQQAAGFAAALEEMAQLAAVNRVSGGVDINELARTGGCLYVVGDMQNTRIIRMQRMLLIRLMMLAKNRNTIGETPRILRVFADEFRVHISRPFIVSLGASAGWRLLTILAFQSFEDLRDCPSDLDADMVKGASIENCAIQLSYRIKDPETAEVLAAATGQILVDDESRKVEKTVLLSETVSDRNIRQAERYLVDENMIKSLPVPDSEKGTIGCGVLVGAEKLAQFCFTSPVVVQRTQAAITPTIEPPAPEQVAKSTVDQLMDMPELEEEAPSEPSLDLPTM